MNWSFLVIDFIIFTAAVTAGFIWGALWVDSEFERDVEYLSAEVESLTNENRILNQDLEAALTQLSQAIIDGDTIFEALQRSVDAYEEIEKFAPKNKNKISPELRGKIRDAWEQADRDIDL